MIEKSGLSPEDVTSEQLLALAREKSTSSRAELASIITDLFSDQGTVLSERERDLMSNILRRVFQEVEVAVRKEVADRLAAQENVPSDLITLLANDTIEVAYPILSRSPVIRDEELIEVIRHRTQEHQLAVAIRSQVSEVVSEALVEGDDPGVIETLLDNANARISLTTMEYIVEQSRRFDSYQAPLLRREDLPPRLARRMFLWVSVALRTFIVDRFDLDQSTVDELLEQAALGHLPPDEDGDSKATELAAAMVAQGEVNLSMLVSTLNQGEIRLFIALFARMAGLREQLVKRFVFEHGGEGLGIACKAIGMAPHQFSAVYSLTHQEQVQRNEASNQDHDEAVIFFNKLTGDAARSVLRKWQRNQEYLATLRELEASIRGA